MNLDKIDVVLPKWKSDIDAAAKNLADLEGSSSYKLARQSLPKMQGKSAKKVAEAFRDFDAIWVHFTLLNDVIKQAETLRQNMPSIFGKADVINKISDLLTGQSIVVQTKEIPLAERGLTGASQKQEKTTPNDIFSKMQKEFEAVAKASALYEQSYIELTDKLGKALEECEKTPDADKKSKLEAIGLLIDCDPISGLEQFELATKKPKVRKAQETTARSEPSEDTKKKVPEKQEKTMGPAPQDQPKSSPSPDVSRIIDDGRVKRAIGTEKLNDLEKLILTKKTPASSPPTNPPITLPKPTPNPPATKTLEDLINKSKKGKL